MKPIASDSYDPRADIRGDNRGKWGADLAFGQVGEGHALEIVHAMLDGWIEVKTDSFENDNLFIELAHSPHRLTDENGNFIWTQSGLNVTEAKYWMYLRQSESGDLRSALIIETARIQRFRQWFKETHGTAILKKGDYRTGYIIGNANGLIPTLGLRIVGEDVAKLRHSHLFDQ
jgi:hypothetical protein